MISKYFFHGRLRAAGPACIILALSLLMVGCGSKRRVPSSPPSKRVVAQPAEPSPYSRSGKLKGTYKPYTIRGETYHPLFTGQAYQETGIASWYGKKFHGRRTANGEVYNMYKLTAAHRILPMHTRLMVKNLKNGRTVQVTVNDRGPFVDTDRRIIDLSYAAARAIGMDKEGLARVQISSVGNVKGVHDGDLDGAFYVQLGAFTQKSNAGALAAKLRRQGYPGTRVERANIDGRTFWRVQAGVFTSYSRARTGKTTLKRSHKGAFIVAR